MSKQKQYKMKPEQFKEKYKALQEEAKAIAKELKPLAKKYRALCKKASALGKKADYDRQLYRENKELGDNKPEPDGWNIHVLFRLTDFDEAEEDIHGVRNLLLNLVDQPFEK